jgi:RNA polymerase sigma-70 factor (ECF subfamily)
MGSGNTLQPSKWLDLYGDYLYSYAVLKVGSASVAEDLVQDTFLSAIRAKGTFQGNSTEKTWLVAILKNKIIDYYRKKDVLKDAREYLADTEQEFSNHFFEPVLGHWLRETAPVAWSESADAKLNHAEFDKVLQFCIQKMPSKIALVFIAKFIDEEETEEICKVHKITSSNYWVIVHRAKVLLRSCLDRNWFRKSTD